MKKGYFTQIPNELIRGSRLNVNEKMIYIYLKSRQGNNEDAWPGHKRIANDLGISISTVKKYLSSLEAHKLISIKAQFSNNNRLSNRYAVKSIPPGFFDDGGPSFLATDPRSSDGYKEYSSQEDSGEEYSTLNTSSKMRKRKSWNHLDPDKPMTEGQKKYATDLMVKTGDFNYEGALEELNSYGNVSQVEGNQILRESFITLKSINDI
jgi:DNA-binding transcriptional MocR family regulator